MAELTAFGKFSRIKRIELGLTMDFVANELGVTKAYLSAVELGKTNPRWHWVEVLTSTYKLKSKEVEKLQLSLMRSTNAVRINLMGKTPKAKKLTLLLQERIQDLTDDQCEQIIQLLERNVADV